MPPIPNYRTDIKAIVDNIIAFSRFHRGKACPFRFIGIKTKSIQNNLH
jgi:hypothetical protein